MQTVRQLEEVLDGASARGKLEEAVEEVCWRVEQWLGECLGEFEGLEEDECLQRVLMRVSLWKLESGDVASPWAMCSSVIVLQAYLGHMQGTTLVRFYDGAPLGRRLQRLHGCLDGAAVGGIGNGSFVGDDGCTTEMAAPKLFASEDANNLGAAAHVTEYLRWKLQECDCLYRRVCDRDAGELGADAVATELVGLRQQLLCLVFHNVKTLLPEYFASTGQSADVTQARPSYDGNLRRIRLELGSLERKCETAICKHLVTDCASLLFDLEGNYNFTFGTGDGLGKNVDDSDAERVTVIARKLFTECLTTKIKLESVLVTNRFGFHETQLLDFYQDIQRIVKQFHGLPGHCKGSTVIWILARRCYAVLYKLLESSEPVAHSLQSTYGQLQTLCRCLFQLKRTGGVESMQDLMPIQLKLDHIVQTKKNGNFVDESGAVPQGQNYLNSLVEECYDLLKLLKLDLGCLLSDDKVPT